MLFFSQTFTALSRPWLLFANKKDIRLFEYNGTLLAEGLKTTIVVRKLKDVTGLDFFLEKNKICWSEIPDPERSQRNAVSQIVCADLGSDKSRRVKVEKKQVIGKLRVKSVRTN